MFWRRKRLLPEKLGALLLGVWLIAKGVLELAPQLTFPHSGLLLAALAVAAGVLILLDR